MEKGYDLKASDGTLGAVSHVFRRLGVIPFFVFVALIATLARLDIRAVFEPPLLLPLLNTVFLSAMPFAVAYLSARGYVNSGSQSVLLLGGGMLTLGSGALVAGWLLLFTSNPNVNVTIFNGAALLSAGFHASGAIVTLASGISGEEPKGSKVTVILAYLGVLVLAALLTLASLQGALPLFFIQGVGPTMVRQAVLGTAVALFAFSSVLFMVRYARSKSDFLYWYSLALALLAVGLFAVFLQKALGSPIGWAGRSAQYLGGIYFLIAVLTAARGARVRGMPVDKALAEFFRAADAQYKALVETSSDAIISVHHEGRVLLWNAAAEKIFGYAREEALDSSLIDLIIPEKYAARMREELEQLEKTGESSLLGKAREIEAKRKDGELFPAELSVSARKTADGWIGTVVIRDISERKQAEKALRESEKRFRIASQIASDVVYERDLQTGIATFYGDIDTHLGYGSGEYPRTMEGWREHVHPEDLARIDTQSIAQMVPDTPYGIEYSMRKKDGAYMTWWDRIILIRDEETGKPLKFIGAATDITERKRMEEETRWSEVLYRTIFESTSAPTVIVEEDTTLVLVNEEFAKLAGYSKDELEGKKSWTEFVVKEDLERMKRYHYARREDPSSAPRNYEFRFLDRYGNVQDIYLTIAMIPGTKRSVASFMVITDRKRAEEALQREKDFAEGLIKTAQAIVLVLDTEGRIVRFNPYMEEISGYSLEEVQGKDWFTTLLPRRDQGRVRELFLKAISGIETRGNVNTIVTKDGREHDIEWYDKGLKDTKGNIIGVLALGQDITERKQAEEALRTSEAQLSNAMKIAQLGYWEYDVANDLFTFNDHFYAIFRTSAEQVGGYTMSSARYAQLFVHPDDMAVVGIEIRKAIESTDPQYSRQLEHRIIYADGEIGYIAVRFFIVKDNQGRTVKTFGANQDITQRKRIEAERERYLKELEQRNVEMERFVYTISHELRTPLVTVRGYTDLLRRDVEGAAREKMETDLHFIENAVGTMARLLEDTLELSRTGRVMNPPEDVPFSALVHDTLVQLTELLKWGGVEVVVAEDLPTVHVDRTRLVEVLVNLVENGIKFMGDQPHPRIEIGSRKEGEEMVVFFVKDNGIGIDKSQHEKVFQLFYKVDKKISGTGAGLAIVKRIIEVHGGRIWIESEKEKGCTVWFTLPVV